MSILVLGGTGFLGSAIARRLSVRDVPFVAVARGHTAPAPGLPFTAADRMDEGAITALLARHRPAALIDIYALGLGNTAPVLDAMQGSTARYVMVSSTDVYANYEGLLRKGSPPVRAAPATESSPLREMRHPYRGNPNRPSGVDAALFDDYDKLPIEEAVRASGIDHAIVRPPMIFGPGDTQGRLDWAIHAQGNPVRIDAQAARWRNSLAFVDDVAEAIVLAALSPNASGCTYNVARPEDWTMRQWLERILAVRQLDTRIEEAPHADAALLHERAEAMDLRYPLTLDSTRIRSELGFTETCSLNEALTRSVQSA